MGWVKKWFTTSRPEDENSAQTLFRFLGLVLRWVVFVVLLIILWISIAVALENRASKKRQAEFDKLRFYVLGVSESCSDNTPIAAVLTNNSAQQIESFRIEFEARQKGRSTNLLSYSSSNRDWDFITSVGETIVGCYNFPELARDYDLSNLVWDGRISRYSVQRSKD